jgi:chaperonin cofactor prefoldin
MKENLLNSIDKRINRLHHEILNLKKQAEKSETEFEKLSVLKYNLHSFREIRHYFNKYF